MSYDVMNLNLDFQMLVLLQIFLSSNEVETLLLIVSFINTHFILSKIRTFGHKLYPIQFQSSNIYIQTDP